MALKTGTRDLSTLTADRLFDQLVSRAEEMADSLQSQGFHGYELRMKAGESWLTCLQNAEDPGRLYERTELHLKEAGWPVLAVPPIPDGSRGVTYPDEHKVEIVATQSPADRANTILHECAHIELGHLEIDPFMRMFSDADNSMEVEADATAYVVAGMHGQDYKSAVVYLTNWSGDDFGRIHRLRPRIVDAAYRISSEIDGVAL